MSIDLLAGCQQPHRLVITSCLQSERLLLEWLSGTEAAKGANSSFWELAVVLG